MTAQTHAPAKQEANERTPWLRAQGGLALVLGLLAFILPVIAGLAATFVVGWLLVLSGIFALIGIAQREAPHRVWRLITALAAVVAGGLMLWNPFAGAVTLVLVIAAYVLVDGAGLIFIAMERRSRRTRRWPWLLTFGALNIVMALLLASIGALAAPAVIGVLVAVNLMLGGLALLTVEKDGRRPATPTASGADRGQRPKG